MYKRKPTKTGRKKHVHGKSLKDLAAFACKVLLKKGFELISEVKKKKRGGEEKMKGAKL